MNKVRKFPLQPNAGDPVFGLGFLSDERDYRLCWLLNQHFPWILVRSDDMVYVDKKSPIAQSYPCFSSSYGQLPEIRIIGNRSKEGTWLTDYHQVDFLLAASVQDPSGLFLDELKSSIGTKIPQIRGLFKLPLPSFCYL